MAETDRVRKAWDLLAPAWIKEVREGRNATRFGLLDPAVMGACGEVAGLDVLDSGCGEGRFSRLLVAAGVKAVTGVDQCEAMIEAAKACQSDRETYHVGDVGDLRLLGEQQFDLAVSCLNQSDLREVSRNNGAVFRALRPGGRFVVANLHPMRSAVGGWHTSPDGQKEHVVLDRYFDEGEREWMMMNVTLTNFHRTLSTYVRGFRESGFGIEDIVEPKVDAAAVMRYPELVDDLRVPNFIIFVLEKPPR